MERENSLDPDRGRDLPDGKRLVDAATLAGHADTFKGLETLLVAFSDPDHDFHGVAGGEERILIPTIYRSNYLSALKALSLVQNPKPLVRTLDFAQRWVAAVPWSDLARTERALAACNAFMDPSEADDAGIRLRLPE